MESVEFAILDWIQQHLRCGFLDTVLPAVSWICNHGEVWIILAAVLLLRKRDRWVGVSVALALVLDLVCCNLILKPLVDRVRPFAVNTAVELLTAPPLDASFPSGHTAAACGVWLLLLLPEFFPRLQKRRTACGIASTLYVCLAGFSRIVVGKHFLSDVAAGMLLMLLGFALLCLVAQRLLPREGSTKTA